MDTDSDITQSDQPSEKEISSFLSATRKQFEGCNSGKESIHDSANCNTDENQKVVFIGPTLSKCHCN